MTEEKQRIDSLAKELSALWLRFLAVENAKPVDYSRAVSDIHQKLLALENKLQSYDNYFESIQARLKKLDKPGCPVEATPSWFRRFLK